MPKSGSPFCQASSKYAVIVAAWYEPDDKSIFVPFWTFAYTLLPNLSPAAILSSWIAVYTSDPGVATIVDRVPYLICATWPNAHPGIIDTPEIWFW